MKNLNSEYNRCYWCNFIINKDKIILPKEIQDKYKNVYLPQSYCRECWEYYKWENKTYEFN